MQKFTSLAGVAAPLPMINVDTDMIIPKQYLKTILRTGLGKHLLSDAVVNAWAMGATSVWLHTCTLDDPAALPNYERRGFRPFRSEAYSVEIDGGNR